MRVLVLGGYGFIGLEASRCLISRGHTVTAVGRSLSHGQRVLPQAQWRSVDIAALDSASKWAPLLDGIDVVVNASGALQDGLRDNLKAVQGTSIQALISACEASSITRFVQISAPGASAEATTAFLRTKANADTTLAASKLNWVILRPGLVWGRTATGGTALVRMLSAVPLVQPIMLADTCVQTVDIDEVNDAIMAAVEGVLPASVDVDLVELEPLTLCAVIARVRAWHGFSPPLATIASPRPVGAVVARIGDALGWLGWRTPLRTTSLRALERGVVGNAERWRALNGKDILAFDANLDRRPATKQDRLFARMQLLLPLIVLMLSAFWIVSGLVGLIQTDVAAAILAHRVNDASALVIVSSYADIALGLALLWRPSARLACFGMIVLTGAYLVAGTLLTPAIWADPLGAFVKTLPAALLALVCAAMLEER